LPLSFCHCHFAIVILPLSFCHCHFAIVILPIVILPIVILSIAICHFANVIFPNVILSIVILSFVILSFVIFSNAISYDHVKKKLNKLLKVLKQGALTGGKRLSTSDLLVLTTSYQLLLSLQTLFAVYKTRYLNKMVNCTEPSPSVGLPCLEA
jgi:hypothetical protein